MKADKDVVVEGSTQGVVGKPETRSRKPKSVALENKKSAAAGESSATAQSNVEKKMSRRGLDTPKWDHVRKLVRSMAYRVFGNAFGDADECASEFSCRYWRERRLEQWPFSGLTEAWILMEAANFVSNFGRRIRRMRGREIDLDDFESAVSYMVRLPVLGPEQLMMLSTTAQQILVAIGKLTLVQRTVIYEIGLRERSVSELAAELKIDAHRVSVRFCEAKKCLKKILKDEGLTEDGIDELRGEIHRA